MNAGQTAILDQWLAQYEPADTYDGEKDIVLTTQNILAELSDMADFEANEVADHIAQAGFSFKPDQYECSHGWIFRSR